jgi:hypothetical protein
MKAKVKASSNASNNKRKKKGATKVVKTIIADDKFQVISPQSKRRDISHADVQRVLEDRATRMANYITSILEPEFAVTEGLVAKQPGLFPIPSTSVSFRDNVNISTDNEGDFALCWNPNFFANSAVLADYRITDSAGAARTCNTLVRLLYRSGDCLRGLPSYVPDVAIAKYRLVSAKLKVTYIGSVLNKSGMMYGCATYDQTPTCVGYQAEAHAEDPLVFADDALGNEYEIGPNTPYPTLASTIANLTEARISNGIWNKNLNVTNSDQGISCLHVPTDPLNEVFYPSGTYFGTRAGTVVGRKYNVDQLPTAWNNWPSVMGKQVFSSTAGAQLCYLVCGHGLPKNVECINIQTYYTYEIIPTTTSAPFLRSVSDTGDPRERELVRTVIREVAPQAAVSRSKNRSIFGDVKAMFKKLNWSNLLNEGLKLVPHILSLF